MTNISDILAKAGLTCNIVTIDFSHTAGGFNVFKHHLLTPGGNLITSPDTSVFDGECHCLRGGDPFVIEVASDGLVNRIFVAEDCGPELAVKILEALD